MKVLKINVILVLTLSLMALSCEKENTLPDKKEKFVGSWMGRDNCDNSIYSINILKSSNGIMINNLSNSGTKSFAIVGNDNTIAVNQQSFTAQTKVSATCVLASDSLNIIYTVYDNEDEILASCTYKCGKQ